MNTITWHWASMDPGDLTRHWGHVHDCEECHPEDMDGRGTE